MPGADSPLAALEALIFASANVVGQGDLKRALGWTPGQIAAGVQDINKQLEATGRPYEIVEVSGGYRFRTRPEFGEMLAQAQPERRVKLSRASLDALAVIAYRQPISRPEVEEIRSVDSGAVVRGLLDRGLVRIVGRRDAPGRPALYGTTSLFLEVFGLASLRDLPDLRDLLPSDSVDATPIEVAIAAQGRASESDASAEDAAIEASSAQDVEALEAAAGGEAVEAEPIRAEVEAAAIDAVVEAEVPAPGQEAAVVEPEPEPESGSAPEEGPGGAEDAPAETSALEPEPEPEPELDPAAPAAPEKHEDGE